MKKTLTFLMLLLLMVGLVACGTPAASAPEEATTPSVDYPTKTIEVVCPYSAGGDTDATCRVLADEMSKILGQTVMVTNMEGAAGAVGSAYVKDADPDGHTVFWCHNTLVIGNVTGVADYNHQAFDMGCLLAESSPMCLWVGKDSQFSSIEDLTAYAEANPGKLKFGMVSGGIAEIMAYAVCEALGIDPNDATFIDCGSGNGENIEMVGGRIDVCVNTISATLPYYQSGDMVPIGVLGDKRLSAAPEVPTMPELGYDVTGPFYYGFYFPKGTDPAIIEIFNAAAKQAAESQAFQELLDTYGYDQIYIDGADAVKTMDDLLDYYMQYKDLLS